MNIFDSYFSKGFLKNIQADFNQIRNQLVRARRDVTTLAMVIDEDPEWATTMAYQAMLRAGRALIFSYGYLPADGQQHKTVVELSGALLGSSCEMISRHFERLRRKRNTFFYGSLGSGNRSEAENASVSALKFIAAVEQDIIKRDPQFKLQLE